MTGPPGHDPEEPVGDLGEEAAKLLGVLAGLTRAVDDHVATGAPECQWCPICRVVHAVRTTPEVRDHLSSAASSLLQAAASLLGTSSEDAAGSTPPGSAQGASDPGGGGPDGGLEHIDLDDPGSHDTGSDHPEDTP